jgi:predicted nucleotidyltransferase
VAVLNTYCPASYFIQLRDAIESLCRLHSVRRLEVFGSILRHDLDNDRSDVDVLVEFEPQAASSFSNFLDLKESLEAIFGRSVDLLELRAIRNKRLRHYIEKSKSPVYVAA